MTGPDIEAVLEGYRAAVLEKDLEAFISLYDAQVQVFDAWARWSYEGADAWREVAHAWFDSLGNVRIDVTPERVHVAIASDLATVHGMVIYAALGEGGQPLRSMRNRLTWIMRRTGGAWKIVHEHTSVPLDFGTKAMVPFDGGPPDASQPPPGPHGCRRE